MNQMNNMLTDTSMGVYIYCLTRTPVIFPHTLMGIDDVHAVEVVEQNGIFAVLSSISLQEFNEEILENNMTDIAWLAPRVKRHEEIIEFVMTNTASNQRGIPNGSSSTPLPPFSPAFSKGSGGDEERRREGINNMLESDIYHTPVVPLRFCTIYKNQESLFNAVMPHREKILNFLDYTADKAEWSVKVFCDKTVFINNYDKNREQSPMAEQTSALPGEAYLLAKKMRKIREERFRSDLQTYLKDIDYTLSQYADRCRFLQCTDKSVHGRPFDMVMNTAFLIEQEAFSLFQSTVNILKEKYKDEGLVFEFTGPWPPYNFCPEL